jgi:hypothetical protein
MDGSKACSPHDRSVLDDKCDERQVGAVGVAATMTSWNPWGQSSYCWVVICKNVRFHRHANVNSGHKIALGETDAVTTPPDLLSSFVAKCDECGKEYSYAPEDILRLELGLPESFAPHPLFRNS